jgi:hypothetical protein
MSYVEDFLELTADIPKDFIRNLKLIREIDEKVISKYYIIKDHQTKICDMKKKLKSKLRNERLDQDLVKQIEKEQDYIITLADHKIEFINECNYLAEYHLAKLNEKIDLYEKSLQNANIPITLSLPIMNTIDTFDSISVTTGSKLNNLEKKTSEYAKSKDTNIQSTMLLKKKKRNYS